MKYKKLNLVDKNFYPDSTSSRFYKGDIWDRTLNTDAPVVITDMMLPMYNKFNDRDKIAWLLEPYEIFPHCYNWIKENYSNFIEVWTHDRVLISELPNAKYVPMGGCWISEDDSEIYPKKRLCSTIMSHKRSTSGHKLRHDIKDAMKQFKVDIFGSGSDRPIKDKIDALKNYAFSVTIENSIKDDYFTEKIIDCFRTGTIPIYYGTKNIGKYFNDKGIIQFSTKPELLKIIHGLNIELYNSKIEYIQENFEKSKEFLIGEKSMFM